MKRYFIILLLTISQAYGQSIEWSDKAKWINPGFVEDTILRSCPIFRKTFDLKKPVATATLTISAHGLYEASINTKRVGDAYFTPGWTNYDKRIQYQQYDVKSQCKKGNNEILVTIGEGWYRGIFGGLMEKNNYGTDAAVICQLDIIYSDGSKEQFTSDNTWSCSTGAILHSDIYGGELYDSRIKPTKWYNITVGDYPKDLLVPTIGELVKKQEIFKPVKVFTTPRNEQVIDFGQNMSGWVQFKVKGNAGDTIKLYHAEMLDKAGNFYTGNLREAKATDIYILKGDKEESFEPHFTWHGFRYVKVEGCIVKEKDFKAIALYSDMQPAGSFSCSNPLINQLQHNLQWSLKSNFLDIPTDCPQRSERLGWTGDAQVFFRTASFNYNVKNFYTKWLADLASDQRDNGSVPNIIPNIYRKLKSRKLGVAGWGDAATIVPWSIYWVYGDTTILQQQYNSMKAWVDHITSTSKNDLWTANGYGDWLAPGDSTSLPFIDQCFWAYSTNILIQSASILGYKEDVNTYSALLQRIKTAFLKHYLEPDGKTMPNTQTSYVLALELNMLPDSVRSRAASRLADLVKANNNHLATGFLGTPHLLHALSRNGYANTAYDLLNQDTYPSWLYPVKMGATTIWEKWNAIRPDSTVQATSFNHYSYGAVGDWLYRVVAGIDTDTPGYKHIVIRPTPGGGLTWAKASYKSPQGKVTSNWEIKGSKILMHVEIPRNTTATIYIPGKENIKVDAGTYNFEGVMTY